MKTQFRFQLLAALLFSGTIAFAGQQRDPGEEVPGDNFSLEGALELFKKSASPQEFEQLLNSPDSKVNNLDLNGDGNIDYIRVIDRTEGNIHTFTMQAVVSNTEAQDIAVIELEKRSNGTAVLQIVGDADIYGIETIIEPTDEVRVNAGTTTSRTVVNVWAWPVVRYVYDPFYVVWVSPVRWSYYPVWYNPWRPLAWHVYDPYWAPYRPYYSYCYSHRIVYAPRFYRPYRTTSVVVYNRHHTQINHYRSSGRSYEGRGYYRDDRSRTTARYNRYDNDTRWRSNSNSTYNGGRTSGRERSSENGRTYENGRTSRSNDNVGSTRPYRRDNSSSTDRSNDRSNDSRVRENDFNRDNNVNRDNNSFRSRENSTRERSFSAPRDNGGSRQQRSFSAPSDGGSRQQRSFSAPSDGGGSRQRSFSAPSGGGGGRSHGTPSGGGGGGSQGGSRGRSRN